MRATARRPVPDPAPPARIARRLDTPDRVRQELCRLYRDGRRGVIDPQAAARLASILAIVARMLADLEIEDRLAALEDLERVQRAERPS